MKFTGTGPCSGCAAPQNTSHTACDADGEVTAATDALGRVTAATYDALGQVTAGYQGQVVNTTTGRPSTWAFSNLSPNSQLSYDVYVHSTTDLTTGDYTVTDAGGTLVFAENSDATAPSLVPAGPCRGP